jgi:hypothetical protein
LLEKWIQMDITAFLGNQRKIILVIFGLLALVLLGLGDYLATAKFGKKVMQFLQQRRYIAVVWMEGTVLWQAYSFE